jgi:hypothetical protein
MLLLWKRKFTMRISENIDSNKTCDGFQSCYIIVCVYKCVGIKFCSLPSTSSSSSPSSLYKYRKAQACSSSSNVYVHTRNVEKYYNNIESKVVNILCIFLIHFLLLLQRHIVKEKKAISK